MSAVANALLKERDEAYAQRDLMIRANELMEQELEAARCLLIEAMVQLEEGKIKTRRNRAEMIRAFLDKHNPQR